MSRSAEMAGSKIQGKMQGKFRGMTRRAGFTLLELVVATAMLTALGARCAMVFRATWSGRDRLRTHIQDMGSLSRTYEVMMRDFHCAVVPPDDSGLQFGSGGATGGGTNVLQFAAALGEPLLAGRQANETVLVQYSIIADPDTARPTLYRIETPYPIQDSLLASAQPSGRGTALLPGVIGATYVFFSSDQQDWVNSGAGLTGLPTAVRVDLILEGQRQSQEQRSESWVFSMPAAKFANDEVAAAADGTAPATAASAGSAAGANRPAGAIGAFGGGGGARPGGAGGAGGAGARPGGGGAGGGGGARPGGGGAPGGGVGGGARGGRGG